MHGIVTLTVGVFSGVHTPVDLVVLCDASSSMNGVKATMMKRSLLALLDELDERDRLSIVRFASDASVLQGLKRMTPENKAAPGTRELR